MRTFQLNGDTWRIIFVNPDSDLLIDRTHCRTIGTTDPETMTVCISTGLSLDMLQRVLIHEISHCALISFDLLPYIHKIVKPQYWYEVEEWLCNFISDYGLSICNAANSVLFDDVLETILREFERLIS